MDRARWHMCLPVFLVCSRLMSWSQASTPQAALEELVTARTVEDAVKHYPVSVEETVRNLSQEEKAEAANLLLIDRRLKRSGYELRKDSDLQRWEIVDKSGNLCATITPVNSFVSGVDALVVLKVTLPNESSSLKLVSLTLEAGEWRVESFGDWYPQTAKSQELIQRLTAAGRNEIAAVSTLSLLSTSLVSYMQLYGVGFPESLEALSGPALPSPPILDKRADAEQGEAETVEGNGSEVSDATPDLPNTRKTPPQYARMLEPLFMQSPIVKDGYVFHYTLLASGSTGSGDGEYFVTATPVEFGKTGSKNYYMDQSGMIRFTAENRDANENDQPLE